MQIENGTVPEALLTMLKDLDNSEFSLTVLNELMRRGFFFLLYGFQKIDEDRIKGLYVSSLPGTLQGLPRELQFAAMLNFFIESNKAETVETILDMKDVRPISDMTPEPTEAEGAEDENELGTDGISQG